MSDRPGPPTLSLALSSVLGASVDAQARTTLLTIVQPGPDGDPRGSRSVILFPSPRRPSDDGPDAA